MWYIDVSAGLVLTGSEIKSKTKPSKNLVDSETETLKPRPVSSTAALG